MNGTDGYTTDVSYPAFFHKEMQPLWLACMARFLGVAGPDAAAPFSACELGCGIGINLLVAAASHPQAHFVGVDFNQRHLQTARAAARAGGLENVEFVHADFAGFARHNQAQFDFIGTHGVWSWIAPPHRASLLDCVASALKPGGMFYLHYMCHPGATDMIAVQHFLNLFSRDLPGNSAQRVQAALQQLLRLGEAGLFVDQPRTLAKLRDLAKKDPHHLAHEFLTDHWHPQHSADVHRQVAEAGLNYLGSADAFNNLDVSLSIPGALQDAVVRTSAPGLAETLKDMARNTHQRMDLFQRSPRPLGCDAHLAQLGATVFALLPGASTRGPFSFPTPIGNLEGPAEILSPLLQMLAVGPASIARLAQLPVFAGQSGLLFQSLQLLMSQGIVHPVDPAAVAGNGRARELAHWFEQHGIALRLVDKCGTAVAGTETR